jgi:hypothetical protein
MGARPWVSHTEHDYARMLLARNASADRERALELIAAALTTYRELGMESWAERLRSWSERYRPLRRPGVSFDHRRWLRRKVGSDHLMERHRRRRSRMAPLVANGGSPRGPLGGAYPPWLPFSAAIGVP